MAVSVRSKLGCLAFMVLFVTQMTKPFQGWKTDTDARRTFVVNKARERKVDLHHTDYDILELQDWELETLRHPYADSCNPPDGKHRMCCL